MIVGPLALKLGGSLLRNRLPPAFFSWLKELPAPAVLLPGGGAAADAVRAWQTLHDFDDDAAHWLAVRALGLTAALWGELLRVPVAGFDALMDAVAALGEARKKTKDSDDVTDRYYDTEAEALNLESTEKGLRALYEKKIAGTNMDELLKVNDKLSQVRGDINVRRGQMKRWDDLAAYSTLTVSMRDRKGYVPPESPEFTTQIGRTWSASLDALVSTGKALVITAVAVAPWLGVFIVLGLVVGVPLRRRFRRKSSS